MPKPYIEQADDCFSEIDFQEVTESDVPEIFKLQEKFVDSGDLSWKSDVNELSQVIEKKESLVAKFKGKIIAYLLTVSVENISSHPYHSVCPDLHKHPEMEGVKSCVSQFCIDSDWQNKGLFSRMYNEYLPKGHSFDVRFYIAGKNNEKSIHVHKNKLNTVFLGENKEHVVLALPMSTDLDVVTALMELQEQTTDSVNGLIRE